MRQVNESLSAVDLLPEVDWKAGRNALTEAEFPELAGFNFDLAARTLHTPDADESFARFEDLRFGDVHPEFAESTEKPVEDAREYLEQHPAEEEPEEERVPRRRFADRLRSWLKRNRGAAAAAGAAEGVVRARFGWLTTLLRQGGTAVDIAATRVRGELASRKLNAADKQVIYEALAGFFGGAGIGIAGTAAASAMGVEPFSAQMLKEAVGMTFIFGSSIALDSSRKARLMEKSGEMSLLEEKHPRIAGLARWLASEKISHVAVFTGAVGGGLMIESMGESILRALQMNMDWQRAAAAGGHPTPEMTPQPAATGTHPPATPEPSATSHPTSTPEPTVAHPTATPEPTAAPYVGGAEAGTGPHAPYTPDGGETGGGTSVGTGIEWGNDAADMQAVAEAARQAAESAKQALTQGPVVSELIPQMAKGTAHEVIYQWLGHIPHRMEIANAIVRSLRAVGVDVRTLHQSAIAEMAKTLGHTFATADEASRVMGVPYNDGGLWATRTITGTNSMAARAYEVANLSPKTHLEEASQLFQWVLKPVLNPILVK